MIRNRMAAAIVLGGALAIGAPVAHHMATPTPAMAELPAPVLPSFAPLVRATLPAVVTIRTDGLGSQYNKLGFVGGQVHGIGHGKVVAVTLQLLHQRIISHDTADVCQRKILQLRHHVEEIAGAFRGFFKHCVIHVNFLLHYDSIESISTWYLLRSVGHENIHLMTT